MFYRFIGLGLLAIFWGLGCSKSEEKAATEAVDSLEGNWLLSITQEYQPGDYRNVNTVLLFIKKEGEGYKAEVQGSKPALPRAKLKSFEVQGDDVHVVLFSESYTFDFLGKRNGSTIRGNMDQGGFIIEPALLVKQEIREISDAPQVEFPENFLEHQKLLSDASEQDSEAISLFDNYAAFQKFCEDHPKSPLSIILYHALVNVLPQKANSDADVQKFAETYEKRAGLWGKRMKVLARFNLGKSLAHEPKFADLGLKYLKETEAQLDAEKREDVRPELDYYRQLAESSKSHHQAKQAFTAAVDGKTEAMETLRKLSDKSPFDPVLMYLRAEAARRTEQWDEALKYHAQLAVWPRLQPTLQAERIWQEGDRKLPEARILELWVKEHGNEAGLAEYKNQVYEEALSLIAKQVGPAESPAGNRVSMMELFTGTNCPPCLGADLATGALEKLYPQSQLIVLRYHLHTNGLDPLVNPRNMERFETLLGPNPKRQAGTPSVFINGTQAASSVGGFLDNAPQIGESLHAELRPVLEENTPLNLQLSAYEHEGEISVTVNLKGIPDSLRDKLRVLLVLAEGELDFPAPNGIRRHEMLVRWYFEQGSSLDLPGTGDFQFTTKTSLREIRERLELDTRSAASQMNTKVDEIPLELKDLRLVALVHDVQTREILQAGVVPLKTYDTKPAQPKLPLPSLPDPEPTTGPMLIGPAVESPSDPEPARAEKP